MYLGALTIFIPIAELIVKGGTDYIMKNKFEILEQPKDESDQEGVNAGGSRRIRTHRHFAHPIQMMVSSRNQSHWAADTDRNN